MVRVGTVVRTLTVVSVALTTLAFADSKTISKNSQVTTSVTRPSAFAVSSDVPAPSQFCAMTTAFFRFFGFFSHVLA